MSTEAARFWDKVAFEPNTGCWLWAAYADRKGYGQFSAGSRADGTYRKVFAHRWAYEHEVGPIPEGLTIDHLCRVPLCVNPGHLEPVTNRENTRRGVVSRGVAAQHGAYSMYSNQSCRCVPCTRSGSDYNRAYRARRKATA